MRAEPLQSAAHVDTGVRRSGLTLRKRQALSSSTTRSLPSRKDLYICQTLFLLRAMATQGRNAVTGNSRKAASKPESLNHLLNFTLPPRQTQHLQPIPRRSRKTGNQNGVWNKERKSPMHIAYRVRREEYGLG